jgi:hypothetical protein
MGGPRRLADVVFVRARCVCVCLYVGVSMYVRVCLCVCVCVFGSARTSHRVIFRILLPCFSHATAATDSAASHKQNPKMHVAHATFRLSRVPVREIVATQGAVMARQQQIRVGYSNYFTRKNAMGKNGRRKGATGLMNSGYRP